MDCDKVWKLMMKSFDREASNEENELLEAHCSVCEMCQAQYNSLSGAFSEIKEYETEVPDDIVGLVMARTKQLKHKSTMHYILFPVLFLIAVVGFVIYMAYIKGPVLFIDSVYNAVVLMYKRASTSIMFLQSFFDTGYFKMIFMLSLLFGVAYGLYYILINLNQENKVYGRISK